MSTFLYAAVLNPLHVALRQSGHGFRLSPTSAVASLGYADDTTVASGTSAGLHVLHDIVCSFMALHRWDLNVDKSEHLVLLRDAAQELHTARLSWSSADGAAVQLPLKTRTQAFRLLGAQLRLDRDDSAQVHHLDKAVHAFCARATHDSTDSGIGFVACALVWVVFSHDGPDQVF